MSFLKSLFGGGKSESGGAADAPTEVVQHNGYTIAATPFMEAGQYQVCGVITREFDDGTKKEHRFIRADRCAGLEEATAATIAKARQIVDLQGERMFD